MHLQGIHERRVKPLHTERLECQTTVLVDERRIVAAVVSQVEGIIASCRESAGTLSKTKRDPARTMWVAKQGHAE
jgi:hypothetical protein